MLLMSCAPLTGQPSSDLRAEGPTPPVVADTPSLPDPEHTEEPRQSGVANLPSLNDMVVSPDGVGPLRLGEELPPADAPAIVRWAPDACSWYVPDGTAFEQGRWVLNDIYLTESVGPLWRRDTPSTMPAVGVSADEASIVQRIDVHSDRVATEKGITLGASRAELLAAHPEAVLHERFDPEASATEVYRIHGARGALHFEVGYNPPGSELWSDAEEGVVLLMRVHGERGPLYSTMFTDDIAGGCL